MFSENVGNKNVKITLNKYYRYLLAIRNEHEFEYDDEIKNFVKINGDYYIWFNPIRYGGKLFQQYLVDGYVKSEQDKLDYDRFHQKELKCEKYKALKDHLDEKSNVEGKDLGRMIILPSSFKGSPRNMQQGYQDSMAMVRKYGKPDLFITFICNPNWDEIKRNLKPGHSAADEPDLVCRVFKLKLDKLLKDIVKNHILGKVVAYTYVVEFQKRGLPHAHMLIILDSDSKIRDTDMIDKVVWAHIPDKKKYPRLYKIVTENMVHGPCGSLSRNCGYMKEDKSGNLYCTKKYPKEFREETKMGNDSYALYKRPDNGISFEKNGFEIDNR